MSGATFRAGPPLWLYLLGLSAALGLVSLEIGHALHHALAACSDAHARGDHDCWLCSHFHFNAAYAASQGPPPVGDPARARLGASPPRLSSGSSVTPASARSPPATSC